MAPLRHSISAVALSTCCALAGAFPLTSLLVADDLLEKLKKEPGEGTDAMVTTIMVQRLQEMFAKSDKKDGITLDQDDAVIRSHYHDTVVDDHCGHRITALHPVAVGTILGRSTLDFGQRNVDWEGTTVFADADVAAKLHINADVKVKAGAKLFGDCHGIAQKTVGIDVLSDGRVAIGLDLTAKNAQVKEVNGTWSLTFNFHATTVGRVISWNVEQVTADNCKLKVLGITVGSVCGYIEKHVREAAEQYTGKVKEITAPKLLKKLENKINTAVGSQVVIPFQKAMREVLE